MENDTLTRPAEKKRRSPLTPAVISNVISTYESTDRLDGQTIELLAGLSGTGTSRHELTVTLLTRGKELDATIGALLALADEPDAFAATVAAGALDRSVLKAVWGALTALGVVQGALSSRDVIAASRTAQGAHALSDDALHALKALRNKVS